MIRRCFTVLNADGRNYGDYNYFDAMFLYRRLSFEGQNVFLEEIFQEEETDIIEDFLLEAHRWSFRPLVPNVS